MYKFWLSRREREELNDLRHAAIQKERAERLTQGISDALLHAKGDNSGVWSAWSGYSTDNSGFWSAWSGYSTDKEPTVRELRAFMDQMSDAEKARVAEYITRGY